MEALAILFGALLADNLLMNKLFGVESFFTSSEKPSRAAAYGGAVTLITFIAGALSLCVYELVLVPLHIGFMSTFVSVLIISATVYGANLLTEKISAKMHGFFGGVMPMISTNCVVLGSIVLCIENNISYGLSLLYLLGAGLGFTISVLVFSSVREAPCRLRTSQKLSRFAHTSAQRFLCGNGIFGISRSELLRGILKYDIRYNTCFCNSACRGPCRRRFQNGERQPRGRCAGA